MIYTDEQVSQAWDAFKSMPILRVLRAGKWHIEAMPEKGGSVDGTRAEQTTPQKVMEFPRFLKRFMENEHGKEKDTA